MSGIKTRHEDRPLRAALWKGWRRRCPNCGKGDLFQGYLKVKDTCHSCDQELFHHRADDGPAYLTIFIVGHMTIPILYAAFVLLRPDPLTLFAIFGVLSVALSLYSLPRLKGAVIGFQWSRRMHGFSVKN